MSEKQKYNSYYRENLPTVIDKLKKAVERNLKIIDQKVGSTLSEDRLVNVLKARRMAAEDTIYFMKEIDRLEGEIHGNNEGSGTTQAKSYPKRMAMKVQK